MRRGVHLLDESGRYRLDLRYAAIKALNKHFYNIGADCYATEDAMAELFGYANYSDMAYWHSHAKDVSDINRKLEALAGPYGYAVYKMLLAQQRTTLGK